MECKICNKESNTLRGLSIHLAKSHKYDKQQIKEYYDLYLKKDNEGECCFCGNEAIFKNISIGYHNICDSTECLGKTRATGTYEFLMYKYGLSKEDALIEQEKRANHRGGKIKDKFDELYEEDNNFHNKRMPNKAIFWESRGHTKEESIKLAKETHQKGVDKIWEYRRSHPEEYKDCNTTQVAYWMKKGFTEEEALQKRTNRQITNTVDNYIKKYGEKEGRIKFIERNDKWSSNIEQRYKDGEFNKISASISSKPEMELFKDVINRMGGVKYKSSINGEQFFIRDGDNLHSYDFLCNDKIIEFNGDYWHCNPQLYESSYYHQHIKKHANEIWEKDMYKIEIAKKKGFGVLVIWEKNYKQNKEKVIQECIEFLTN